ncbi:MAG: primosomal replication protein N [Polaromonas sp.]|nr:primosomal replication protein N [Polaromonas sp.]
MNHVELTACIAEASPLRYTPAGIPAANFVLEHESEVVEAGVARQVKLTVRAVAFGALAEQSVKFPLGKPFRFTGFLINARTSKGVVFHIQALHQTDPVEQVPNPH